MNVTQTLLTASLTAEQLISIAVERAIVKSRMDAIRLITDKPTRQAAIRALREDVVRWTRENAIELRWLAGAAPRPAAI